MASRGRLISLGVHRLGGGKRGHSGSLSGHKSPSTAQKGALKGTPAVSTLCRPSAHKLHNRLLMALLASHQLCQPHRTPWGSTLGRGSSTGFAAGQIVSLDKSRLWSGLWISQMPD